VFWGVLLVGKYGIGSILGPLGVHLGYSLSAFVHAGAFGQNVNFCIFKVSKRKKNQSLAPTLTLNSNNKFLKKK